jgi:adenosylcobinamide kinase / adenosylcobinamide-phosphate guanylyltransferase
MPLVMLIGGARSGKSSLAVHMARAQPSPVFVIATAEAGDDDMASRIRRHRRERPASWETVEEPLELAEAIARVPGDRCLIIDCLTLWTANMLAAREPGDIEAAANEAAARAAARPGLTVTVSNEVGLGIVPEHPLGRSYRDLLGRVNTVWASAAHRSYLLVAGRVLALSAPEELPLGKLT